MGFSATLTVANTKAGLVLHSGVFGLSRVARPIPGCAILKAEG